MAETSDPKTLAGATDGVTKAAQLPAHFPGWAAKLAELYFSGTTSMFVLHGNTFDVVRAGAVDGLLSLLFDLACEILGERDAVTGTERGRHQFQ